MDNRFAYMRKHLGISQKEASVIFNTRLDTIKKWDADRLSVPQQVIEELYDLVRYTRSLISTVVKAHIAADEDGDIAEVYLMIPDEDTIERFDLPRSEGWIDRVIGGLIGELATYHTYGTHNVPDHYEFDFQWYEFWEHVVGDLSPIGFAAVKDEVVFTRDLTAAIQDESFKLRYDFDQNYYYFGVSSSAVDADRQTVWIKCCNAGRYAEHTSKEKVSFFCFDDDALPHIYNADDNEEAIGLLLDQSAGSEYCADEDFTDTYALGALIFEKLAEKYPTQGDLLKAFRRISGMELGAEDDDVFGDIVNWGLKTKRFMSHKFVVTLFQEVKRQADMILFPETLVELCNIVLRSEPAEKGLDQQYLSIDMGDAEITVLLDLRDIIDANDTKVSYGDEMEKAMQVIKAVIQGNDVSTIPSHSAIEAVDLKESALQT